MSDPVLGRVGRALGVAVAASVPLGGGCLMGARKIGLADGRRAVVKAGRGRVPGHLALEGAMLEDLAAAGLPVPRVLHAEDELLVMEWIENDGGRAGAPAQRHAAELLAALHGVRRRTFGYAYDTVIGVLPQPNPEGSSWVAFFRDHRLMRMARAGHDEGGVPGDLLARLERLAARLGDHLDEPPHPALIHGDMWSGNVLVRGDRIAGFVDPAVYHGHPEVELAFATLFGPFGRPFFEAYAASAPFSWDFFEVRRDLYNLYPLLVHVRLFGGGYLPPIERTLGRLGV